MYEKIKTRRDMKDSFIYENTETTSTRKGFEKHVRLLLSLVFFAVIGVGNVWGATATLSGFANATPAATSVRSQLTKEITPLITAATYTHPVPIEHSPLTQEPAIPFQASA